jgi:type IV pilus assembly protein PilQ
MIGKSTSEFIDIQLSAMEDEGKVKVLSSPKIITQDNQPAYIESGDEIPYQTIEEGGAFEVSFKKAVVSLKVTPHVIGNNIFMDITINKDTKGGTTVRGDIIINTNELTTKVMVVNGETVVIGGLIEQTNSDTLNKVPFLSEIPLLGWLFKKNTKVNDKNELLIFITPSVLKKG